MLKFCPLSQGHNFVLNLEYVASAMCTLPHLTSLCTCKDNLVIITLDRTSTSQNLCQQIKVSVNTFACCKWSPYISSFLAFSKYISSASAGVLPLNKQICHRHIKHYTLLIYPAQVIQAHNVGSGNILKWTV